MNSIEKAINYTFKNKDLLKRALTHSSYVNECSDKSEKNYERLEFLGDAILDLIVSDILFFKFDDIDEGMLSKLRAKIVCEASLYEIAKDIDLGRHIRFSKGEKLTGGDTRPSILADVVESIIGAIYLDSNFDTCKKVVNDFMVFTIDELIENDEIEDYKSALQVLVQSKGLQAPVYKIVKESGPEHSKTFESVVLIDDKEIDTGIGKSKRASQQEAAKKAYMKLNK